MDTAGHRALHTVNSIFAHVVSVNVHFEINIKRSNSRGKCVIQWVAPCKLAKIKYEYTDIQKFKCVKVLGTYKDAIKQICLKNNDM